jgi:hypothetical protein
METAESSAPIARGWCGLLAACAGGGRSTFDPSIVKQLRVLSALGLALSAGTLPVVGQNYLALKGPSTLRFERPVDRSKPFSWPDLTPPAAKPGITSGSNSVSQTEQANPVNPVAQSTDVPSFPEPAVSTNSAPQETLESSSEPLSLGLPAPEPLEYSPPPAQGMWVSPQMLTELLQQRTRGTNAPPADFLPQEGFWFLPPAPYQPVPSTAVYKTQ